MEQKPLPHPFVEPWQPTRWLPGEDHILPVRYFILARLPTPGGESFHPRDIPRYPQITLVTKRWAQAFGCESEDWLPYHKLAVLDVSEIDEQVARAAISELIGVKPEDVAIEQLGLRPGDELSELEEMERQRGIAK